ncbi:MAG: twin-arginine translocase TatA/TatE family subunit [Candidatus Sulfotelmatobacter sp.]
MSFSETIFLFFLALIIFGPKKLPEIARQVGKALNEFKRASNEFKAQIEQEISHLEVENKQTILPPSHAPEGATSRSSYGKEGYAGAELEAITETPALAAGASEGASSLGEGSPGEVASSPTPTDEASVAAEQTPPAAPDPSEAVTVSDPVGAAAAPESHPSEPHFSEPHA